MVYVVYTGQVGLVLVSHWYEPRDPDNPEDVAAAERCLQTRMGWFANPVFGNGDYPDVQKKLMADLSREQGLPKSVLPEFTQEEKELNKGLYLAMSLARKKQNVVGLYDTDRPSEKFSLSLSLSLSLSP